jgi:hypothetical protein
MTIEYEEISSSTSLNGRSTRVLYNLSSTRQPLTPNGFYRHIRSKLREKFANRQPNEHRFVILRFISETNLTQIRTVKFQNIEQFAETVQELLRGEDIDGSDVMDNSYIPDFTWFMTLQVLSQDSESGGRKEIKSTMKFYKTLNPISKNNNCYFNCIIRFFKLKKQAKTLRKELGFEFNKPISINDIKIIEQKLKIGHLIYEDTKDDSILYRNDEYPMIPLVLNNNHYEIMLSKKSPPKTKRKSPPKKEKEKELPTYYLFFDFETTFNRKSLNFLEVYAGSWYLTNNINWKFKEKSDIKNTFYETDYVLKKFLNFIRKHSSDKKLIIIGFNNSRFDNFFVASAGLFEDMVKDVFYCNNSILQIRIHNCTFFDLCRFIASNLKNACESFNTCPKKQPDLISHNEVQLMRDNGQLENFIKNNKDIEKYTKLDVLCLCDLFFKFKASVKQLLKDDVEKYMTIGQMSYQVFSKNITLYPPKSLNDDIFIRSSLCAGRSQAFYGRNRFDFKVQAKDVCSLYPFVMMNREFPDPSSPYIKTNEYIPNKLGIYNVHVIHQNMKWKDPETIKQQATKLNRPDLYTEFAPIVFPKRNKDEPLDWNYRGEFSCQMTNLDIECIRDNGGEVIVSNGIYWEKTTNNLFTF